MGLTWYCTSLGSTLISSEERREEEVANKPAPATTATGTGGSAVSNRPVPPKPGMPGGPPPPPGGGGPPAPPPPPVLTTGSNKLVINKAASGAGAAKAGSGDLIGQLKNAVGNSGFLRKAEISDKELEKRGQGVGTKLRKTVLEEVSRPNIHCIDLLERKSNKTLASGKLTKSFSSIKYKRLSWRNIR